MLIVIIIIVIIIKIVFILIFVYHHHHNHHDSGWFSLALVQFVRAHLVVRTCQGAKDEDEDDGDGRPDGYYCDDDHDYHTP